MPDPRQLGFLEKLSAEKAEAQAIQLARARASLAQAEEQLGMLRRYEGGYHVQLEAKFASAISADTLTGHHRFMKNVASAVRQQETEVARRAAMVEAVQRLWQESERRRQGFRIMAEKATSVARLAEERRLQKSSDEFAARRPAVEN